MNCTGTVCSTSTQCIGKCKILRNASYQWVPRPTVFTYPHKCSVKYLLVTTGLRLPKLANFSNTVYNIFEQVVGPRVLQCLCCEALMIIISRCWSTWGVCVVGVLSCILYWYNLLFPLDLIMTSVTYVTQL